MSSFETNPNQNSSNSSNSSVSSFDSTIGKDLRRRSIKSVLNELRSKHEVNDERIAKTICSYEAYVFSNLIVHEMEHINRSDSDKNSVSKIINANINLVNAAKDLLEEYRVIPDIAQSILSTFKAMLCTTSKVFSIAVSEAVFETESEQDKNEEIYENTNKNTGFGYKCPRLERKMKKSNSSDSSDSSDSRNSDFSGSASIMLRTLIATFPAGYIVPVGLILNEREQVSAAMKNLFDMKSVIETEAGNLMKTRKLQDFEMKQLDEIPGMFDNFIRDRCELFHFHKRE